MLIFFCMSFEKFWLMYCFCSYIKLVCKFCLLSIWVCSYLGMNSILVSEVFSNPDNFSMLALDWKFVLLITWFWESTADQKVPTQYMYNEEVGTFWSASAGLPVIMNFFYIANYLHIYMNQKRKHFIVQISRMSEVWSHLLSGISVYWCHAGSLVLCNHVVWHWA